MVTCNGLTAFHINVTDFIIIDAFNISGWD